MNRILRFFKQHQVHLLQFLFVAWAIQLLKGPYQWIAQWNNFSYYSYEISDWLINYEGGFVRRGLIGQILYAVYQWHPYPVNVVIQSLYVGLAALFIYVVLRMFRKEGWSVFILVSWAFLGRLLSASLGWFRRDIGMLLAVYGLFYLFHRYMQKRNAWTWMGIQAVNVLTILSHEATFFFSVPLLMCIWAFHCYQETRSMAKAGLSALGFFALPLLAMAAVCICKGNQGVVDAIWASWQPCMEQYPQAWDASTDPIDNGVGALAWNSKDTFRMHIHMNFLCNFHPEIRYRYLPSALLTLLNFVLVYYFVTRINTVDLKWNRLKPLDTLRMSDIMLLQFVSMLPMFTVLSCDFGRTIPYWVFSTLFAYHFLQGEDVRFPSPLTACSARLQHIIDRLKWLSSPWVYALLLLYLPLSMVGGATYGASWLIRIIRWAWHLVQKLLCV
ncbi:MAG: hypothetical protein ACI36X_05790 [Bacteroidaceae bacterium]